MQSGLVYTVVWQNLLITPKWYFVLWQLLEEGDLLPQTWVTHHATDPNPAATPNTTSEGNGPAHCK